MTEYLEGDKVTVAAGSRNCLFGNQNPTAGDAVVGESKDDCGCVWVIPEDTTGFLVLPGYLTHRFEVGDLVDVDQDALFKGSITGTIFPTNVQGKRKLRVSQVPTEHNPNYLLVQDGFQVLPKYLTPYREPKVPIYHYTPPEDRIQNPIIYRNGAMPRWGALRGSMAKGGFVPNNKAPNPSLVDIWTDVPQDDMVQCPPHYTGHPSGVEAIEIIEHSPTYALGAAMKYIWRVSFGGKGDDIEDLNKAVWYLQREVKNREAKEDETVTN